MKRSTVTLLFVVLFSLGLGAATPLYAAQSSLPGEPQEQSPATRSVQAQVDEKAQGKASEKRKQIIADAGTAIEETERALQALEDKDTQAALEALETATGKLELILARDPALGLAPIDVEVTTHDLLAEPDTVKAMIHDAEEYLEDGEIQRAPAGCESRQ